MGKTHARELTPDDRRLLPSGFRHHAGAAVIIATLVAAVYLPALQAPFLYDDQRNITENTYIRMTGLSVTGIKKAMVQDKFQLRPVANFTFALDYYLHRLNKTLMHAENMALHAIAAFCLYLLAAFLARKFGNDNKAGHLFYPPLLAALAWSLHPAHTQAVTYIVQRQTLMAVCFSLIAFLFYVLARESAGSRKKAAFFVITLFSLLVAGGSKEIAIALPVVCFLYELMLIRRDDPEAGRIALVATGSVVAVLALIAGAALLSTGLWSAYVGGYEHLDYGPFQRMLTETRIIAGYLGTMAFPHPVRMALDHDPQLSVSLLRPVTTLPAVVLILAAFAAGVEAIRRGKLAGVLLLGFLVSLAPESSFIPVELEYDHRMYMPSLFVIPPVVFWLVNTVNLKKALPLMCAALVFGGVLTYSRNQSYGSKKRIWKDSAQKSPAKVRPWSNLCAAYLEEERPFEALTACELACKRNPQVADPLVNKAKALYQTGQTEKAAQLLEEAVESFPKSASAHYNYGRYLEKIKGAPAGAIKEYRRSLELEASHLEARLALGTLLKKEGDIGRAREELSILVKDYPECGRCWAWYGIAAYESGYMEAASHALSRAKKHGQEDGAARRLESLIRSGPSGP